MTMWEPEIQPPHPSTVSDLSEIAQKILLSLERKWAEAFQERNTRTAHAIRTPGNNNYYQQIYTTRFGGPPQPMPQPHTSSTSLQGSQTISQARFSGQLSFSHSQASTTQQGPQTGILPTRQVSNQRVWLPESQPWTQESQSAPCERAIQPCKSPTLPTSLLFKHQSLTTQEIHANKSPVLDFGSDDEGQQLTQTFTQSVVNQQTNKAFSVCEQASHTPPPVLSTSCITPNTSQSSKTAARNTHSPIKNSSPINSSDISASPEITSRIVISTPDIPRLKEAALLMTTPESKPPKSVEQSSNKECSINKKCSAKAQLVDKVMSGNNNKRLAAEDKNSETTETSRVSTAAKKKKKRFQVPFKSQQQVNSGNTEQKQEELKITSLTGDEIKKLLTQISTSPPLEVCLTLLYKEGGSQLRGGNLQGNNNSPCSVLLAVLAEQESPHFYCMDLNKNSTSFSQERQLMQFILLSDCRKVCFKTQELFTCLMHTYGFQHHEVSMRWIVLDPLLGCWLLDPDSPPKDFKQVMQTLALTSKNKEISGQHKVAACHGLVELSRCAETLYQQLVHRGLWRVFLDLETPLTSLLAVMEMEGVCVDKNVLVKIGITLKKELHRLQQHANKVVGSPVLLTSPMQLRRILYEQLKLDASLSVPLTEQRSGKSTSEAVLKMLEPSHPLPGIILQFRHLQKVKSTYVDGVLAFVREGKLRTTWEQIGAATGRISSRDPNLQAIPRQPVTLPPSEIEQKEPRVLNLRSAFLCSQQGNSLLAADFKHVELRLFAHFTRDSKLTAMFADTKRDIFETLAQQWLGCEVGAQVSSEQRERTKRVVYAVLYGAGAPKLEQVLGISAAEARQVLSSFTAKFPQIRSFSQRLVSRAREQGYLASLSGRRRLFPQISSPDHMLRLQAERQALNFLIQGSAADVCKAAMLATERALQQHTQQARLLLQIHDELVWEVPDNQLSLLSDVARNAMESTCQQFNLSVNLPVAVTSGKTWADLGQAVSSDLDHTFKA